MNLLVSVQVDCQWLFNRKLNWKVYVSNEQISTSFTVSKISYIKRYLHTTKLVLLAQSLLLRNEIRRQKGPRSFPPSPPRKKKKKKTHVTHNYQKEENHPSDPPLKKKVQLTKKNISREFKDSNQGRYAILKKEKRKQNERRKKKGGNGMGPVIIYRLKGAEVWRILGITQFSGERRGELPMKPGGGAVIRILQSPMGGWGNQLNSIVTHPESSDHPSLLPSPSPPAINNDKSLSKDQLETSSSGITEVPRRCEAYCKGKFDLHFGGYLNFRWLITQKKMSTCIKSEVTAGRGSPCGKYGSIAKSKGRS